jgi:hypothetical protein
MAALTASAKDQLRSIITLVRRCVSSDHRNCQLWGLTDPSAQSMLILVAY